MTDRSTLLLASDHAAVDLKNIVAAHLRGRGISVEDMGAHGRESVDYPDYAMRVARPISEGRAERGILLCGTGLGMSMVANRFPHVRAALCNDLFSAGMSRRHNNANVLVLGGRVLGDVLACAIVDAWLDTPFEGGRHQTRLDHFNGGV
ncbi:ribose 5-phosphate isomerase B [Desulfobotulus sp.]|jgi:ribose 5-phosphate isomerase B|uniref:ribose 5-phosphate isomerase B n=1 Tax=Desulfobotulus sp. TaxID=1940337 RepID=UPI002A3624EC|nr:ribose 5-phosphate isomerase B [Desulfobotulus sp.]MDY0163165.1 ribose 5-phosphate isomerase B [Desulfobotulus sp.]